MKNANVIISFEEEKLSALRMYMEQKNLSVEAELTQSLANLYTRHVPANVRDFIELRSSKTAAANTKRPKPDKTGTAEATEITTETDA